MHSVKGQTSLKVASPHNRFSQLLLVKDPFAIEFVPHGISKSAQIAALNSHCLVREWSTMAANDTILSD